MFCSLLSALSLLSLSTLFLCSFSALSLYSLSLLFSALSLCRPRSGPSENQCACALDRQESVCSCSCHHLSLRHACALRTSVAHDCDDFVGFDLFVLVCSWFWLSRFCCDGGFVGFFYGGLQWICGGLRWWDCTLQWVSYLFIYFFIIIIFLHCSKYCKIFFKLFSKM